MSDDQKPEPKFDIRVIPINGKLCFLRKSHQDYGSGFYMVAKELAPATAADPSKMEDLYVQATVDAEGNAEFDYANAYAIPGWSEDCDQEPLKKLTNKRLSEIAAHLRDFKLGAVVAYAESNSINVLEFDVTMVPFATQWAKAKKTCMMVDAGTGKAIISHDHSADGYAEEAKKHSFPATRWRKLNFLLHSTALRRINQLRADSNNKGGKEPEPPLSASLVTVDFPTTHSLPVGVFHKKTQTTERIQVYEDEYEDKPVSREYTLFVPDNKIANLLLFSDLSEWVTQSEATCGCDPGNTGCGYDVYLTGWRHAEVCVPESIGDASGVTALARELATDTNRITAPDHKHQAEYHRLMAAKALACGFSSEEVEKGKATIAATDESTSMNLPFDPAQHAGKYSKPVDKTGGGYDYWDECTTITVHPDGAATYDWHCDWQGGSGMPHNSSKTHKGRIVGVRPTATARVAVLFDGSAVPPTMKVTGPPSTTYVFQWTDDPSTGDASVIDMSKFNKVDLAVTTSSPAATKKKAPSAASAEQHADPCDGDGEANAVPHGQSSRRRRHRRHGRA